MKHSSIHNSIHPQHTECPEIHPLGEAGGGGRVGYGREVCMGERLMEGRREGAAWRVGRGCCRDGVEDGWGLDKVTEAEYLERVHVHRYNHSRRIKGQKQGHGNRRQLGKQGCTE